MCGAGQPARSLMTDLVAAGRALTGQLLGCFGAKGKQARVQSIAPARVVSKSYRRNQGHTVDALAWGGDEGRVKLR